MAVKTKLKDLLTNLNLNGKVDTFIIGAQKAGTSSLHNALVQHNAIYGATYPYSKECQFWNNGPGPKSKEEYRRHFKFFKQQNRLIDSTPDYLSTPGTIARILDYNKRAKFIILLRNPVHRFLSAYNMYHFNFAQNTTWRGRYVYDQRSIEEVIEDEISAEKEGRRTKQQYLYRGNYAEQIIKELKQVPGDQVFISIVEDEMYTSWQTFSTKLQNFLDVSYEKIHLPHENTGKGKLEVPRGAKSILEDYYNLKNKQLEDLLQTDLKSWAYEKK